jgi:phenylpropionate dioxygenase-like ring-hydroxylating dioxygenase large terminal subunit
MTPLWARALSDPQAFRHEQNRLAQVWTMLGFAAEIPRDNDWFRTTIGDRSIFVQRFGEEIRAFENRCAHRHFPLRNRDRGNGVVRCAFHHWQYDKQGRALGIPRCPELFGVTPRELGATLTPVDIEICGGLIFGRFAGAEAPSLEDYLGDGFPILKALTSLDRMPRRLTRHVKSNWQLPAHISMDDYHLVAVHPSTFGRNGYLTTGVTYFRFGDHSAYFPGAEQDAFGLMSEQCRNGTYQPHRFRIFHFFPNLSLVLLRAPGYWLTMLMQFHAEAMDRTEVRVWYYPAPFGQAGKSWLRRYFEDQSAMWAPLYITKVLGEDNVVNAQHQSIANRMSTPILGKHEERVGWFIEAYEKAMQRAPTP